MAGGVHTSRNPLTALTKTCVAADPEDHLPWLVLCDYLDERGDHRGKMVRWWRHHRPAVVAPGRRTVWTEARSDRWNRFCFSRPWLARLLGVEHARIVLKKVLGEAETPGTYLSVHQLTLASLAWSSARAFGLPTGSVYGPGRVGGWYGSDRLPLGRGPNADVTALLSNIAHRHSGDQNNGVNELLFDRACELYAAFHATHNEHGGFDIGADTPWSAERRRGWGVAANLFVRVENVAHTIPRRS